MPFGFDEFLSGWGDPQDPRNLLRLAAIQAGTPLQPVVQRDPAMPPLPPDGNPIGASMTPMPPTLPSVGPTTPRDPEKLVPLAPSTFDPAPTSGRTPEIKTGLVADERLTPSSSTADSYMDAMQKAIQNKQFNQALADIGSAFKKKPAGDFGAMPQAPQVARASGVNPGAALKGAGTAMLGKYIDSLGEKRSQILAKGKKKRAPLRPYQG